ncbi:MAG: ribbon-helix-helix protein, CopG family [Aeoliella sp.]
MPRVVQARVDDDTDALIDELKARMGWSDSEVVRQGIKSLRELIVKKQKRRIVGIGEFDSGVTDLGSNKKHLEGFGR